MKAFIDAYRTFDTLEYSRHETVFFSFTERCEVSIKQILEARPGFPSLPEVDKKPLVIPGLRSNKYGTTERANIVVSDDPISVYAYIDKLYVQKWFTITQISQAAADAGTENLESWTEFFHLDPDVRARILATPLMMKCQRDRISESQLLGYQRYTWDDFASKFTVIDDPFTGQIVAFPREQTSAYAIFPGSFVSRKAIGNSRPSMYLSFDNTDSEGKEAIWIQTGLGEQEIFKNIETDQNSKLISTEQNFKILGALDEFFSALGGYLIPTNPTISMAGAPSLMSDVKYTRYLREKTFGLDELKNMARDLNVKGFSTKTKAELSIVLAETIANMGTSDETPGLVFTSHGQGTPPPDVYLDQSGSFYQDAIKSTKAEDYFKFSTRVVASAAYAPNLPPVPGGRVPTDGTFPSYYVIEPLDIFN
jgi:hypothetical protein